MYLLNRKYQQTFAAAAVAASFLVGAGSVQADDDFPKQSIKVGVMYDAGGASDYQARIATSEAKKYYGQSVVIVNKVGAGGMAGWNEFVTNVKPDGYELASYNVPSFIAQSIQFPERVKYNTENMIPIANWGADPAVLAVPAESDFDDLDDLVAYAKENPGRITANGAGQFTGHHVALMQFMKAADIKITYVPDTGAVPAMKKILANQIGMGINNLSDSYRNKDRMKILAIASEERDEHFLPDVPTFKELGYDVDEISTNLRGLMALEGTPEPVLKFLEEKSIAMFNDEEVQKKMLEGGSPLRVMGREETLETWKRTEAFLEDLFEEAGE